MPPTISTGTRPRTSSAGMAVTYLSGCTTLCPTRRSTAIPTPLSTRMVVYIVSAGTRIRLAPGESIHIRQRICHDFSVEQGSGSVLLGKASQCSDGSADNRFNPPVGRFSTIEEDEPPIAFCAMSTQPQSKESMLPSQLNCLLVLPVKCPLCP